MAKSKPKGGAPFGNRNALKTGRYTRQMRALRREVRTLLADAEALLRNVEQKPKPGASRPKTSRRCAS